MPRRGVAASEARVAEAVESLSGRVGDDFAPIPLERARLDEARLLLSFTRVLAPCDGVLTNVQRREGTYARTGEAVMTLIDSRQWLVVANIRENSLLRVRTGTPALVALRGTPGVLHRARVADVGWGVERGQGIPSGLLPNIERRSSWIPPTQHFQVRLELVDPGVIPPRVGMTGSVTLYTDPDSELNDWTRAWHQLLAWLYYW